MGAIDEVQRTAGAHQPAASDGDAGDDSPEPAPRPAGAARAGLIRHVASRLDRGRRPHGVGVIAPFDFALDWELWRWVPDSLSLYVTRTHRLVTPVSVSMAEQLRDEDAIRRATDDLLAADPWVVVYACASASFMHGLAGERRLREFIEAGGAPAAVTTSGAIREALDALGAGRVAVATPYDDELTHRLIDFLAEAGHETVSACALRLDEEIAWVTDEAVAALIREAHSPGAEAVVVSCTNLPTFGVVADLEDELGVPVVSANLATMWAALRRLGIDPPPRPERLLAPTLPAPPTEDAPAP